jgi:hypothetical protein
MLDAAAERVHAHGPTLTGAPARDGSRTDVTSVVRGGQRVVIDGMRMLFARAARAELARSQSGSTVRRTNELCASHSAPHDVQASRYEPPE